MYDELVKSLRVCGKALEDAVYPDWDVSLYTRAADAIESMSEAYDKLSRHMDDLAALMPRWIPVTERLPKADEYDERGYAVPYLVMNGWMRVTARRTKDYWVLFGNGTVLENVTHWMPLPEPPKEET